MEDRPGSAHTDADAGGTDPDRDTWEDDWDRDDWKHEDWGVPAAESKPIDPNAKSGGTTSYHKGIVEAAPYLTLGLQIAFGMLFFVGVGYVVDGWLEISPWGLVVGASLGMVGVFTLIVRISREAEEESRKASQKANRKGK